MAYTLRPIQPTRTNIQRPTPPPISRGWNMATRADLERIASRYQGGIPSSASFPTDRGTRTISANPAIQPMGSMAAGETKVNTIYRPPKPTLPGDSATAAETAPTASMPPAQNSLSRWSAPTAADKKARFMEEGGSERTYNRAQVAAGIRPRVDARAKSAVGNSTAGDSIRASWGWRDKAPQLPY